MNLATFWESNQILIRKIFPFYSLCIGTVSYLMELLALGIQKLLSQYFFKSFFFWLLTNTEISLLIKRVIFDFRVWNINLKCFGIVSTHCIMFHFRSFHISTINFYWERHEYCHEVGQDNVFFVWKKHALVIETETKLFCSQFVEKNPTTLITFLVSSMTWEPQIVSC